MDKMCYSKDGKELGKCGTEIDIDCSHGFEWETCDCGYLYLLKNVSILAKQNKHGILNVGIIDTRNYIDECILYWREKLQKSDNEEDNLIARCYIDAFQSVRVSLFGEVLKSKNQVPADDHHSGGYQPVHSELTSPPCDGSGVPVKKG